MHNGMQSHRWSVIVAHRRCGKTVAAINHIIREACLLERRDGRYAYVAPQRNQAKMVAWSYLKQYTENFYDIGHRKTNESELWIEVPNNAGSVSRIYVLGADKPDSLRGPYWDGVLLDEVAQMKPNTWYEVFRPALADRQGWAVFIGTPKGQNMFCDLYHQGLKKSNWFVGSYPVTMTSSLSKEEIEENRRDLPPLKFRQEFMCDFAAEEYDTFIGFQTVLTAIEREHNPNGDIHMPTVMGVDPARYGDDLAAVCIRRGYTILHMETHPQISTTELADRCAALINQYGVHTTFVDAIGLGAGTFDRLKDLGYRPVSVNAGGSPKNKKRYGNLRAEMWGNLKDWLERGGCLPDRPSLKADLLGPKYTFDGKNRYQIESKENMRKRGMTSPDEADAIAMTLAHEVNTRDNLQMQRNSRRGRVISDYDELSYGEGRYVH